MKYLRFIAPCTPPEGAAGKLLDDGETIELVKEMGKPEGTDVTCKLADIAKWLPPVDPPNLLAIGKNYPDHAKELPGQVPDVPILFIKATTTVTAHKEPISLPKTHPDEVDYEAELAVVIGKTAKHVSREKAFDYILGYCCANDVSARDCQLKIDKQWARGKSFDTFCPLGPYLVTDIDPGNLYVRLYLNGELMQDQPTSEMMYDIPALIEHLSSAMTLLPGTVILTGTPCGVGAARNPEVYLREGDVVKVEVEGLGTLENPVILEK